MTIQISYTTGQVQIGPSASASTNSIAIGNTAGAGFNGTYTAAVAIGNNSGGNANNAVAIGYNSLAVLQGQVALGNSAAIGNVARKSFLQAYNSTTSTTQTLLYLDGVAATKNITLQVNSLSYFKAVITAKETGATFVGCWTIEGCITQGATASTATIQGTPVITDVTGTALLSGSSVTYGVDTTNGALQILVTSATSTQVDWFASIDFVELKY